MPYRSITVAHPPAEKPLMVWDGDCGFCSRWVQRWQRKTGDRVDYQPWQTVYPSFPEIAESEFREAVYFIATDGSVASGAAAVFASLATNPKYRRLERCYRHSRIFAAFTEWLYRCVANSRTFLSRFS